MIVVWENQVKWVIQMMHTYLRAGVEGFEKRVRSGVVYLLFTTDLPQTLNVVMEHSRMTHITQSRQNLMKNLRW